MSLFRVLESIIIAVMVFSSFVYISTLLFPVHLNRYRYILYGYLGDKTRSDAMSFHPSKEQPCTHCNLCVGCSLKDSLKK